MLRGRAVPRGKIALPRDPKNHPDTILVFADGDRVAQALEAGATYAGGQDLIEKVRGTL